MRGLFSIVSRWAIALSILSASSPVLAADLVEIRQRGFLIVAVKDNVRPLGFRDSTGELAGMEIEIARRLATELLGRSDAVVFQPVSNQERISTLLADEADLVIAQLSITEGRARLVDFSQAYYLDRTAFVTRQPSLGQISQVRRGRVAVLQNSSTVQLVRSRLPNARLVEVASYQQAKEVLDLGQADVFAADSSVLTGWVQQFPTYRLLPERWAGEPLAIAMPRGSQYRTLRQQVNAAIDQWKQDGWLAEQIETWGL
ncbi:transporter substrate-binding domain-containing protein [Leptolyngbya sp. AN02str]|uniref:transporter substrate-binding domain-containing protein n=1 Tax=Leptolyngbya sp. AN02str TaxID=3423363 RepID=UPI003D3190E0